MKNKFIIVLICLIVFLTRFLFLDKFPAGFTPDEAAQGYTAYSILKTGKDEWGVRYPLFPRSFGDFKPPLYTYLLVPSVAVLGLNEYAVRLPNAFLSFLAIGVVYLLTFQVFKKEKIALLASLLLAISPWHISLSRGGFESNLTTLFLPLAVYLFLFGLEKNRHFFIIFSSILFGLNLFSYHSAKLITPLIFLFLILWKKQKISKINKSYILVSFSIIILFFGINFAGIFLGSTSRPADISIFSGDWQSVAIARYTAILGGLPDFLARIFNNKLTFTFQEFLANYFSYISPYFLFTQGAGEATYGMVPRNGLLYLIELPFIIVSFYCLLKERKKELSLFWFWFLVSPIPASLSRGVGYHANRVAVMMPAVQIICAFGFEKALEVVETTKKFFNLVVFKSLIFLTLLISFLFFVEDYFFQGPKFNAPVMGYGWKEVFEYLKSIEDKYDRIIISRRFSEPQTMVAFYKKWDPIDFQRQSKNWLIYEKMGFRFVDQLHYYQLGKYYFRNFNFPDDFRATKTLLVGKEEDFFEVKQGNFLKIIYYPGPEKKIAFKILAL